MQISDTPAAESVQSLPPADDLEHGLDLYCLMQFENEFYEFLCLIDEHGDSDEALDSSWRIDLSRTRWTYHLERTAMCEPFQVLTYKTNRQAEIFP